MAQDVLLDGGKTVQISGIDELRDAYYIFVDAEGNIQVRMLQYDPDEMEWVPSQGGTGTGTEVQITNASIAVTGPLTNAELRAADVKVDETRFRVEVEKSGDYIYCGEAALGSAVSDSAWRIKRIDTASGNASVTWADGNDSFDNRWDQRASISYS